MVSKADGADRRASRDVYKDNLRQVCHDRVDPERSTARCGKSRGEAAQHGDHSRIPQHRLAGVFAATDGLALSITVLVA